MFNEKNPHKEATNEHLSHHIEFHPKSMRLGVVSERMREEFGDLRYKTIADSKREMRDDVERLRGDFHNAIRQASNNGKESRTK